jgi:ABC-type glutathione transport system ATPase component
MTTRMSDAAFLQARAVTKAFKVRRKGNGPLGSWGGMQTTALRAVDDVSLDIARGEVFAIVGESGSGKTTLANLLARVTVPTEGRIVLDGEEISRATGIDLRSLRRQIQIVFQDPGSSLNPRHTVGEIVALPLKLGGMRGRRDRAERIAELLEAVHLPADFVRRYPVSLSGGQKQRVNIARALALEPRVHPRPADGAEAGEGAHLRDRHPQFRRRARHRRPGGGDVFRQDRRSGHGRSVNGGAIAPVYKDAVVGDPGGARGRSRAAPAD